MNTIQNLFDLNHTLAKDYLAGFQYPWEALKGIKDMIVSLGAALGEDYAEVIPQVWVHRLRRLRLPRTWAHPVSLVPVRKSATVLLSGAARW